MSIINVFQISFEIWGCILSVIIAIISGDRVYKNGGALKRVWFMLLLNALLLSSDALAYVFRGDPSTFGFYMTRISNFLVFVLEGTITWNVAVCVQHLIQNDENKSFFKDKWIRISFILIAIQLIGTILTPFTNLYYYFDNTNHYHRGVGVILSFVMLGLVCAICAVKLFLHRKNVPTNIMNAFKSAVPIVAVCFALQMLRYGISFINIGLTIFLMTLYLVVWKDTMGREVDKQISEMEEIINELISSQKEQA